MLRLVFRRLLAIAIFAVFAIAYAADLHAQQNVDVGANEVGGVVTSSKGPEAGVWVIAETTDLPTKFTRIVVTDDQGRYLIPDLPIANYRVWVRGYGLVDSPKNACQARLHPQSRRSGCAQRCSCRSLLSGSLLVRDVEDSAGGRLWRSNRHP